MDYPRPPIKVALFPSPEFYSPRISSCAEADEFIHIRLKAVGRVLIAGRYLFLYIPINLYFWVRVTNILIEIITSMLTNEMAFNNLLYWYYLRGLDEVKPTLE